jgi:hypothetical protein
MSDRTKHEVTTPNGAVINLAPFCGVDDPRFWIRTPMSIEGKAAATDGSILIIVDAPAPNEAADFLAHASIFGHKTVAMAREQFGAYVEASSIKLSDKECSHCDGTGRARVEECEACDGDGEVWHKNKSATCPICDGSGVVVETGKGDPCKSCGGTGRGVPSSYGNEYTIASHYVALLQGLPNCRVKAHEGNHPVPFTFDGGCGVVMPLIRRAISV